MTRSAYAFCTPRGTRGGANLLDTHARRRGGECGERVVAIVQEIARGGVFRKSLAELLRRPRRGRMRGDADVHDAATPMGQDDQHEQQSIRDGGHDEEIGGGDLADMIREKRAPRLGGRPSVPGHVLRHGRLTHGDAQFSRVRRECVARPTTGWRPRSCESTGGRPEECSVDPRGIGSSTSRRGGSRDDARRGPSRA